MIARVKLPISHTFKYLKSLAENVKPQIKQTQLTLRRSANTKLGDEIIFVPPQKAKDNTWKNAHRKIQAELKKAEAIVLVCPANDWDAIGSILGFMIYAAKEGKPCTVILPENLLIPYPYLKIVEELKNIVEEFPDIHFLHSDDPYISTKINTHIGNERYTVCFEADFPHSPISLKTLANTKDENTPDYNIRNIVEKHVRGNGRIISYVLVDHHKNRTKQNLVKTLGGVFINNPDRGACTIMVQELIHPDFLGQVDNFFHKLTSKKTLANIQPLVEKHKEYTLSAISTDFCINILAALSKIYFRIKFGNQELD
jgi:hypothetical protein